MKHTNFKPGQLVTINQVVYKCTSYPYHAGCSDCDIQNDIDNRAFLNAHHNIRDSYYKICNRCAFFITFKRLSI